MFYANAVSTNKKLCMYCGIIAAVMGIILNIMGYFLGTAQKHNKLVPTHTSWFKRDWVGNLLNETRNVNFAGYNWLLNFLAEYSNWMFTFSTFTVISSIKILFENDKTVMYHSVLYAYALKLDDLDACLNKS